jgi:hypothetical protein
MEIEMIQPIAMDQGLRFAIRERPHRGAGVVTESSRRKVEEAPVPQQKIRIRLRLRPPQVDKSARDIVDTAQRTGATITGPVPLPTEKNVYCGPLAVQGQDSRGALRGAHGA